MGSTADYPCILLGGCSLLPFQLLPLHLFEPRYRRMVENALAGDRRFAVAEAQADADGNEIPGTWATLGRILSHHPLPDGRHVVLLEGETRLQVAGLARRKPYPALRAVEIPDDEAGPSTHIPLARVSALVERLIRANLPEEEAAGLLPRLQQMAASHPGRFADAAAGHLIADQEIRRRLLAMSDPESRLLLLAESLGRLETERQLGPEDPGFDPRVN
ncbi:MAG: LON peptidase substrate-binding domain-containing protein [Opitutia bacterium]